jgi:hypothetical protein
MSSLRTKAGRYRGDNYVRGIPRGHAASQLLPTLGGYAKGAPLDDAVFSTRNFNSFERIAFVGEKGSYARAVVGLMPTRLRRDIEKAKRWVSR